MVPGGTGLVPGGTGLVPGGTGIIPGGVGVIPGGAGGYSAAKAAKYGRINKWPLTSLWFN